MTYTIQDAHRDGRHASTHPDDQRFWVSQGCEGCAPKADPEDDWVIEEADPEVGIFGDSIVHACAANDEFAEATSDVTIRPDAGPAHGPRDDHVHVSRVQGATNVVVEQQPAEWFVEPGRELPARRCSW